MKLLQFDSYESYVEAQTERNIEKLENVWVSDKELQTIADYFQPRVPDAQFGICHGVRNGYEVRKLRELLGFEIMGTEISKTPESFENIIQWDFHDIKDEWIGKFDFIYSNSWDHSCDPERMFANWFRCLSPQGRCFLHWTPDHSEQAVGGADCFGISIEELKQKIAEHECVEDVLHVTEWFDRRRSLMNRCTRVLRGKLPSRHIQVLVVKHRDAV